MGDPTFYELSPIMREVLHAGGTVKLKPRGISMLPFIRPDIDEILLQRPTEPLHKGDIFLYQRPSGKLVLHRLVRMNRKKLVFRGDNQIHGEHDITQEQLIGVISIVRRGKKEIAADSVAFWFYRMVAFPCCLINRLIHRGERILVKRGQN